jgi:hypothetical protein
MEKFGLVGLSLLSLVPSWWSPVGGPQLVVPSLVPSTPPPPPPPSFLHDPLQDKDPRTQCQMFFVLSQADEGMSCFSSLVM